MWVSAVAITRRKPRNRRTSAGPLAGRAGIARPHTRGSLDEPLLGDRRIPQRALNLLELRREGVPELRHPDLVGLAEQALHEHLLVSRKLVSRFTALAEDPIRLAEEAPLLDLLDREVPPDREVNDRRRDVQRSRP